LAPTKEADASAGKQASPASGLLAIGTLAFSLIIAKLLRRMPLLESNVRDRFGRNQLTKI
jgi:hypothetical protein